MESLEIPVQKTKHMRATTNSSYTLLLLIKLNMTDPRIEDEDKSYPS
jgi:hypothetical protein